MEALKGDMKKSITMATFLCSPLPPNSKGVFKAMDILPVETLSHPRARLMLSRLKLGFLLAKINPQIEIVSAEI